MIAALGAIEKCLIVAGCVGSAWLLANAADRAVLYQPGFQTSSVAVAVAPFQPKALARLEIPALHLSLPVVEGTNSDALRKAVGHIHGTAMPGGLGNVGLAGHRDTFFRPLRQVEKNLDILLVNGEGAYHYRVTSTEIVPPDALRVLDISDVPELTLITCYPFDFVGSAPNRFIVHAKLQSLVPVAFK